MPEPIKVDFGKSRYSNKAGAGKTQARVESEIGSPPAWIKKKPALRNEWYATVNRYDSVPKTVVSFLALYCKAVNRSLAPEKMMNHKEFRQRDYPRFASELRQTEAAMTRAIKDMEMSMSRKGL